MTPNSGQGKVLANDNHDAKLATDYEAIRRREYELITSLLETLPKVDNLDEERVSQARDALFHADHPFLAVFVGPFSSGKSSIINALLGETDLLPVGPIPTTDHITILRWGEQPQRMRSGEVDTVFHPSQLLKKLSFVDTPGLESVFQKHEETTRKFLHRSDVVFLVMLATQAMTARNLEYLQMLQDYGKTVIVLINQADLLSPEEAESVRKYVTEQSQSQLSVKPEVWLISARKGLEARKQGTLDQELWQASGLNRIERYVDEQLSDVARLRQKLQTPIQIIQNVNQSALTSLRTNQAALDQYRSISENLDGQLAAQKRELERNIRDITEEVSAKFGAAAMRGSEAIRDIFRFSGALGSLLRGLLELVGLAGVVVRRSGSYIGTEFEKHKAFEPIKELPEAVDNLGPRLEGKDSQDMDDLVKYARREIEGLPPAIRTKVIGNIQPPLKYDRVALQEVRPELEKLEDEARVVETGRLETTLRNTLLYLAAWEIILVVFAIVLFNFWGNLAGPNQSPLPLILLILLLGLGLLGLAFMPLRGRMLESAYTNRMLNLQGRYNEALNRAANKQVEYGMRLRRDAVGPLTRLVETQTQIQTEQLTRLQAAQQEITGIETELAALGSKKLLGIL
jgi:ribosome biogenesis GTPase A